MNSVFLIDTLFYGGGVESDDEIPIEKLDESDFGPIISKFYKIYQYFSKQNKFMEYSHQILDDYLLSVFCFVLRYKSRESDEKKKKSDDDENWNKRETFAWLFERIVKDFVSKSSSSQGSIHKKINRLSTTQSTFLVNILIPELLKCMQVYQKETLEISDEMKEQREKLKEMRKKEEEVANQSSLIHSGQKEEEEKFNNFKSDPQQSSISRGGGISYYINKSFFHLHLCVSTFHENLSSSSFFSAFFTLMNVLDMSALNKLKSKLKSQLPVGVFSFCV